MTLTDVSVLTGRNLVHIAREPLQLSDVTIQPLLFVYVFGSGVVLPGGGSYTDFAIAGLLALNLTTSAMGTAVGLSTDLNGGVIDRFRTLPMWRAAVLVGRSLADLSTAALCALIVAVTGLVIGWRPDASLPAVIGRFALFLLFSYALSWGCGCLGIVSKGPGESGYLPGRGGALLEVLSARRLPLRCRLVQFLGTIPPGDRRRRSPVRTAPGPERAGRARRPPRRRRPPPLLRAVHRLHPSGMEHMDREPG